jgi:acyl dehydratase
MLESVFGILSHYHQSASAAVARTVDDFGLSSRPCMKTYPEERFSSQVSLTPATVAEFAGAAGDDNPVHHDHAAAASSRYGRLIASGTHTTALLLGLTSSHSSNKGSMVGLEFWVTFRRPVFADETIRLEWMVISVARNEKLNGDVVDLRGRIQGEDGRTAVGAKGRILLTESL